MGQACRRRVVEEMARAIVLTQQPYFGSATLPFLLALGRVRSGSVNKSYHAVADGIAIIPRAESEIPVALAEFQSWVARCVDLLLTKHVQATTTVSLDTARHHLRSFERALTCLVDYSDLVPAAAAYLPAMAKADPVISDARKMLRGEVRPRSTYQPLRMALADFVTPMRTFRTTVACHLL